MTNIFEKLCLCCDNIKPVSEYHNSKNSKDGINSRCKICINAKRREYRRLNSNKVNEYNRSYRRNNKERHYTNKRLWESKPENKACKSIYMKKYFNDNKSKIIESMKHKRHNDIQYRLKIRLRNRLRTAIKNNQKVGSAVRDLGCTIQELIIHLESQFQPDMTWNNYGQWHIDHIIPLSKFELTDRVQLRKACYYKIYSHYGLMRICLKELRDGT